MKFNTVTIRDPMVNNIEGASLLVPEGWTVAGGFVWMPLYYIQANLLLSISDPETGAVAEIMPLQQYVWAMQPQTVSFQIGQNWLGSVFFPPPPHPAEFVQAIWARGPLPHLLGARLERVEDLPQVAAEVARENGAGRTVWATRLRYTYQYGGRAWEEDVYTTLLFNQSNGVTMFWYGLGHAMRAPAGMLDRMTPMLAVPIQSTRRTLEWSAMLEFVRQLYQQGRRQQLDSQIEVNKLWIQYRQQAMESHRQVFEQQQASQDRQNFITREILGGVQTYLNPFDSRTVELPPNFGHFWVSNNGQVIGTNDALLDPRSDNRFEWRRMEMYRP